MQHPPATFQDFLKLKHLKDWPEIPLEEALSAPRFSLNMIHQQFFINAPFSVCAFGILEANIGKNIALLDNHASKLIWLPALDDDKPSLSRVFLTEADIPELSQNAQETNKTFTRIHYEERVNCVEMYPDYLSQAIFTAFYRAFPQSHAQFNGEIKTEIVDRIFQWFSGIKPVPCSWEKWDLGVIDCPNDQNSHENINTSPSSYLTGDEEKMKMQKLKNPATLRGVQSLDLTLALGTHAPYTQNQCFSQNQCPPFAAA
ncbi:protein FAM227B isoform X2 [Hyla sarda]|uniref:protein FAM227B isoform X2 n=1 Tax=Hyla sarda TaxID=327740 RepID=UPI0024C3F3B3|nr:protein FAM227B isoform X2 [Hyla sarda]